jgi:hypothetical protein
MSSNPENIDVTLSLLDAGAMKDFVAEIQEANSILRSFKEDAAGLGVTQDTYEGDHGYRSVPQAAPQPAPKSTGNSQQSVQQPVQMPNFNKMETADVFAIQAAQQRMMEGSDWESQLAGEPGRASRATSQISKFASRVPGAGMVSNAFDDEGALRMENITQAGLYTLGTAVAQPGMAAVSQGINLLNPFNAQQAALSQGLGGGPTIGPVTIPTGGGTGQVMEQRLESMITGLTTPGLGTGTALDISSAMGPLGWAADLEDTGRLIDISDRIASSDALGKGLSPESITGTVDQMARYGASSTAEIEESFRGLGDAAKGARMGLEEFNNGLNEVAEGLQGKGLTFGQGRQAAMNFSATTNMAPQVLSQIMDNPFFQGQMMGQYGLPPELQGLVAEVPGAVEGATGDTISMLRKTLSGVAGEQVIRHPGFTDKISARDQETGLISSATGMPVEELRTFERDQKTMELQGHILAMSDNNDREARRIAKQYPEGSEARAAAFDRLRSGEDEFSGSGTASLSEIMKLARKREAGFTDPQLDALREAPAADRERMVSRFIKENAPARTREDGGRTIAFTGLAEKMLKEVLPTDALERDRREANREGGGITSAYTSSGTRDTSGLLNAPPSTPFARPGS